MGRPSPQATLGRLPKSKSLCLERAVRHELSHDRRYVRPWDTPVCAAAVQQFDGRQISRSNQQREQQNTCGCYERYYAYLLEHLEFHLLAMGNSSSRGARSDPIQPARS